MQNKYIVKEMYKRAKEYEKHFRNLKYTGRIEGIVKKQKPKKIVIGSPLEVRFLKNKKELPGTTFAVSWSGEYDEVAIASIYYAISNFKDMNMLVVGDNKTRRNIIEKLDKLGFLLNNDGKKEADYSFVNKEKIRSIIISCSDSRVLDSAIFDDSNEDVLIINNVGNILSSTVFDTIKYYLASKIEFITVLTHSNCGAVNAACFWAEDKNLYPILFKVKTGISSPVKSIEDIRDSHYIENGKNTITELIKFLPEDKTRKIAFYVAYHNLNTGATEFPIGIEMV